MGATYLSMQVRTTNRDAAITALEAISAAQVGAGLQFYVTEPVGGWLAVFPNFTPELEHTAKVLSGRLACLVVLLLSADEDELYCMFFRDGKQLPWFKVGAPRKRTGKEREKLAAKLEALTEVCDERSREKLVEIKSRCPSRTRIARERFIVGPPGCGNCSNSSGCRFVR